MLKASGKYPFLWLLIPLVMGIAIAEWTRCPAFFVWIGIALFCLHIVVYYRLRKDYVLLYGIGWMLFTAGWSLATRAWAATDYEGIDENETFILWLEGEPEWGEKTIKIEAVLANRQRQRLDLYVMRDSLSEHLVQGDWVLVYGQVKRANKLYYNDFDYERYTRLQGKVGSLFAASGNWECIGSAKTRVFDAWRGGLINFLAAMQICARKCQKWLLQAYTQAGVGEAQRGIVAALTIGDRSELGMETKQQFSTAGAMHILAVSGLHVGVIYGCIYALLTLFGFYPPLEKELWRRILLTVLIILGLWVYAFVTGLSPSVLRAALMLSILTFGRMLYRGGSVYNTLFASAFIILIINPLSLYSVSFQLSYAGVWCIVTFEPIFRAWVRVRNRFVRTIWGLLAVSLAAQIGTFPLTLYYFGQTSNYFALTNLVVIPMASVIIYTALIFFILLPTGAGVWIGKLLNLETGLLNRFTEWIEGLPFASTKMYISGWEVGLLILLIILFAWWLQKVNWQRAVAVMICLVTLISVRYYEKVQNANYKDVMISSERGCEIVACVQKGQGVVLSTDTLTAQKRLQRYLLKRNVQEVEWQQLKGLSMWEMEGKLFVFVNDSTLNHRTAAQPLEADYLLLGDVGRVHPQYVLPLFQAERVCILSSMRPYKRKQMRLYMEEHNIDYQDISNDEAIQFIRVQ